MTLMIAMREATKVAAPKKLINALIKNVLLKMCNYAFYRWYTFLVIQ